MGLPWTGTTDDLAPVATENSLAARSKGAAKERSDRVQRWRSSGANGEQRVDAGSQTQGSAASHCVEWESQPRVRIEATVCAINGQRPASTDVGQPNGQAAQDAAQRQHCKASKSVSLMTHGTGEILTKPTGRAARSA